jgi:glycosyltransferase involved in cell wall biosynthesis
LLHAHNLHGSYFDLRALPHLSQAWPFFVTLHDAWMLSGHCAHSFNCDRWITGCGNCPDLTIYPAIQRDATAFNWQRKRSLYARSRLYLATPSRWLLDKVERSMLVPALSEARVIPNGVDTSVFKPADRNAARTALNLPQESAILLFAARGIRTKKWRDYQLMHSAVEQVASVYKDRKVLFIALGEAGPRSTHAGADIRFVPYIDQPETVALYYQSADLYLHAARVDNFPTTILESFACGTPVVATRVGGIPEQVRALSGIGDSLGKNDQNTATGALVEPGNLVQLTRSILELIRNKDLRFQLGRNAEIDAASRFDLQRQVSTYLDWYCDVHARRT